jgi:hypothetical protein
VRIARKIQALLWQNRAPGLIRRVEPYFLPNNLSRKFTARAWPRPNVMNFFESASLFTTFEFSSFITLTMATRPAHRNR